MNQALREGFVSIEGRGQPSGEEPPSPVALAPAPAPAQQPPQPAPAAQPVPAPQAASGPQLKPATDPPKISAEPPVIEPSPAELPPLDMDKWPITVKLLHRAIRNNTGQELNELTLREPRAGDINRFGNPIRVNADGDWVIDERKMSYMISALTNILPPLIDALDTRDWNSIAYRLRRFFLPDPTAW